MARRPKDFPRQRRICRKPGPTVVAEPPAADSTATEVLDDFGLIGFGAIYGLKHGCDVSAMIVRIPLVGHRDLAHANDRARLIDR